MEVNFLQLYNCIKIYLFCYFSSSKLHRMAHDLAFVYNLKILFIFLFISLTENGVIKATWVKFEFTSSFFFFNF